MAAARHSQHGPAPLNRGPVPPGVLAEVVTVLRAAGCVFAEEEAELLLGAAGTCTELDALVHRRTTGEPLEIVVGWVAFCGLRIAVEPGVFVPRRRTEFLVEQAILLARGAGERALVAVDLCCGSGAVGVAVASAVPGIELHAVDVDPVAVRSARGNVGAAGSVYAGDLYQPLPARLRGRVNLLVANAPYVPTDSIELMPPEARDHEPRVTLDGGADGQAVVRRVIAGASDWLAPGGHLLVETGRRQAPQTLTAITRSGLTARLARSDEVGATVAIGTRPTR